MLTKKDKIENYDAVAAELNKLRLAIFDMLPGASKFPFRGRVTVDAGKEVDGNYDEYVIRVSVSERAMPYYMVESINASGNVDGVNFWTESEVDAHRIDSNIYWRALRHGLWKLTLKLGKPQAGIGFVKTDAA